MTFPSPSRKPLSRLTFHIAAAAVLLAAGCEAAPRSALREGDVVSAMVLPALERGTIDLSQWRGRTVLLNIWATWCGPCREEMPALERLSQALAPDRYAIVGISIDADRNLAREFARKLGVTFPLAIDASGTITRAVLGVSALPDTLVIGPDGRLAARVRGYVDWSPAALQAIMDPSGDLNPRRVVTTGANAPRALE